MASTTRTIANDISFGLRHQETNLDKMKRVLGVDLINSTKEFGECAVYDYHNPEKKIWAEVKTRRGDKYRINTFPTTVVGHNKICWALANADEYDCYLFFWYPKDGLYYIKVDERVFKLKPSWHFIGTGEDKFNVYIPVDWLTKVEDTDPTA